MFQVALIIILLLVLWWFAKQTKKENFFKLGWDDRNRQFSMLPVKPPSKPFSKEDAEELSEGFPLRAIPGTELVCRLEPKQST